MSDESDSLPFTGLMENLRSGNADAARQVFDRFARRLAGLAASRIPAPARARLDPEDVAQSVLRTFFRRHQAGEFRPDHWDALWSLLAVLAVRKCGHKIGHVFAAKRDVRREVSPGGSEGEDSRPEWTPPDTAPSVEEAAILEETLAEVLATLRERERPIVLLRLQGFAIPDVAGQCGCSERTVHRTLETVRTRLQAMTEN
ncbi:ECF-type sigma factor [Fimbriiglobus ruber]|uniref:Serine/threonine-protein kinase Pkn1 n=1 Tax=Fimbriiglobus ruber TaxID=1908690 RepID=A0A225DKA9_9BACT|nr:ECF-type sigma factor [Fimbriiglobus ruber]OWK36597.1 Serine/threonine-protein kinase Pkn1 [Fimbriiglobus ruber]